MKGTYSTEKEADKKSLELQEEFINHQQAELDALSNFRTAKQLGNAEDVAAAKLKLEDDYQVDAKRQSVALTEVGIDKVEKNLKIENLYAEENQIYSHLLENAFKAENFYIKNDQYVVRDSEIIIVDEFTG